MRTDLIGPVCDLLEHTLGPNEPKQAHYLGSVHRNLARPLLPNLVTQFEVALNNIEHQQMVSLNCRSDQMAVFDSF